jgi:hypothetical protein
MYFNSEGRNSYHHGIYVGKGEVVHITKDRTFKNQLSSISGVGKYKVRKEPLDLQRF